MSNGRNFKFKVLEVLGEKSNGGVYECNNGIVKWSHGKYDEYSSFDELCRLNPRCKFELIPEPKQFTKADLRTFDLVVSDNGIIHKVFLGDENIVIDEDGGYFSIISITDDLKVSFNHYLDIKCVARPKELAFSLSFDISKMDIVYQRPQPRKLTKSEAERMLSDHLEETVQIEG
jgi:hypothetical protein